MAQNNFPGAPPFMAQPPLPFQAPVNPNSPYQYDSQGLPDVTIPYQYNANGAPTYLAWGGNLDAAFAHRHRVTEPLQLNPAQDPTINSVRTRQELYISKMVQAIFNMDGIKDNSTFNGLPMFTRGHEKEVSGYDVEAACRLLFAAVLARCETGYRGAAKNNQLLSARKDFQVVDRDGDCATRIANVILALHDWKSVCREIVLSDVKIYQLANAPASVADAKLTQWNNNKHKAKSTENDRAAAAAAAAQASQNSSQTAIGGTQTAATDIAQPATKRRPRKNNNKPKRGRKGAVIESQQPSVPANETEMDLFAAQQSYNNANGEQLNPAMGAPDFPIGSNDMLEGTQAFMSYADGGHATTDPPAYGSTYPSGMPPTDQMFTTPFLPAAGAFSTYTPQGLGYISQPSQGSGGHTGGMVPFYNCFNGQNSHYSFGPLHVTSNGGPTTAAYTYGNYPASQFGAGFDAGNLGGDLPVGAHAQFAPAFNTASKHSRTATMDVQSQPPPTRWKRYESPEGAEQVFGKSQKVDGEEALSPGAHSERHPAVR